MDISKNQPPMAIREAYLEEVSATLRLRLTPLEVFESISEMRAHIDAMAAAYEELGMESEAAMAAALDKFGSSAHIGSVIAEISSKPFVDADAAAFIATLASGSVFGMSLMVLTDYGFAALNHPSANIITLDLQIGGGIGATIAMVAWKTRLSPAAFGAFLAIGLNIFLWFTLYQTYIMLGKPWCNLQLELLLTPAIFILGSACVRFAQIFRRVISASRKTPTRPTAV